MQRLVNRQAAQIQSVEQRTVTLCPVPQALFILAGHTPITLSSGRRQKSGQDVTSDQVGQILPTHTRTQAVMDERIH